MNSDTNVEMYDTVRKFQQKVSRVGHLTESYLQDITPSHILAAITVVKF
jgi:hypothetical protein